jgi:hypothetical protein
MGFHQDFTRISQGFNELLMRLNGTWWDFVFDLMVFFMAFNRFNHQPLGFSVIEWDLLGLNMI